MYTAMYTFSLAYYVVSSLVLSNLKTSKASKIKASRGFLAGIDLAGLMYDQLGGR